MRPCGVEGEFYERDENQTPSQLALKMEQHLSEVCFQLKAFFDCMLESCKILSPVPLEVFALDS